MNAKIPSHLEAWVGGYLGPSYRVELRDGRLVYEIYEQGYELHSSEEISPTPSQWGRFLNEISQCGVWEWDSRYAGTDSADGTTWYVTVGVGGHDVTSRGLNHYPPGFVDFMRSLRRLLDGRQFS
jgi:hypothetical protein